MILLLLTLTVGFSSTPLDSVQFYYAHGNVDALRSICRQADSREADLLCRYRLYPLTANDSLINNVPEELSDGTARELALLSGLWGFRAAAGSIFDMVRCGKRAHRLLEAARELDASDPMVLLIEGQSLLFRPGMFGGNAQKALLTFRSLHRVLSRSPDDAVSEMEAELWTWYALDRIGDASADVLKRHILEQRPPALFVDFLQKPPGS